MADEFVGRPRVMMVAVVRDHTTKLPRQTPRGASSTVDAADPAVIIGTAVVGILYEKRPPIHRLISHYDSLSVFL